MESKTCRVCKQIKPNTKDYFEYRRGKTTNRCKICTSLYNKKYQEMNEEKLKLKSREYYQERKEEIKEKSKLYREENKEYISFWKKNHYQNNLERERLVRKKYQEENKEKLKLMRNNYYQKNKERIKNRVKMYYKTESGRDVKNRIQQKRRALKRGFTATLTRKQWMECKLYFNDCCAYCGENKKLEQEHFYPLIKNGEFSRYNIIPACRNCNASKSAQDFFEWYPKQDFYSKQRERKILKYLQYNDNIQQMALL